MRVAVTGGTGFIGGHAVAALVAAGHEVQLLARERTRVAAMEQRLGLAPIEDVVEGDVRSPLAVEQLLGGCDAVVHAGSVYSLDVRDDRAIRETNVAGTELVVETGLRLGLDPIVHVSSIVALLPTDRPLGPDSPIQEPPGAYARSKAASERMVRERQAAGAPLVSVMPGLVGGPGDPYLGETNRLIVAYLRGQLRVLPRGGALSLVDARDVAAVIASALEPGRGPRRYTAAPHFLPVDELARMLNRLTARRVRAVFVPNWLARAGTQPARLQRFVPFRLPLSVESVELSVGWRHPVDCSRAETELGVEWRSPQETLEESIRSLVGTGALSAKAAGALGRSPAAGTERAV
jgi:nucleoside-diphosphate-sugar epimerase